MRYLIDTNICIYVMNQRPASVVRRFRQHTPGDIGVSSITVAELEYGAARSQNLEKNRQRLREFLAPFEVVRFDESAAAAYGEIRAQLERRGNVIGPLDMLIAGHAMSKNLTLVTNNEKEFQRVGGLNVVNWASEV